MNTCQQLTLPALVSPQNGESRAKVERTTLKELKHVQGKMVMLFQLAEAVLFNPTGSVAEVVYPVVGEQTLRDLVEESRQGNPTWQERVYQVMRGSYSRHYRRRLGTILELLTFHSNNQQFRPVLDGLEVMRRYLDSQRQYSPENELVLYRG